MSQKFKALGLALVVVCAFGVVSAAGAQAANWTVGGKAITSSQAIAETALLTKVNPEEKQASSTLTVPKLGITLTCTSLKVTGGQITPTNTGSATGLDFAGCIVASAPNVCQVHSVGAAVGSINTLSLAAELKTVTGKGTFAVFKPTGATFVEIVIEKIPTKTCAVSGTYAVTGSAALKVATGTSATFLEGTANEEIQTAAGVELLFGSKPAVLDAKVDLALASDANWGVDA
jgi:hypothetical protein